MSAPLTSFVPLNLLQGPSRPTDVTVREEKWMLKQVQHDGEGAWRA